MLDVQEEEEVLSGLVEADSILQETASPTLRDDTQQGAKLSVFCPALLARGSH